MVLDGGLLVAGALASGGALGSAVKRKILRLREAADASEPQLAGARAAAKGDELHWQRGVERHGLGNYLTKVNHISLVVQDVGDSLFFYANIIGLQQIRRPNFDRHGAWLSLGNIELHLIKGKPDVKRGNHPEDLIVSHIAIEVEDVKAVLRRLQAMQKGRFQNLQWRQNVSVPTAEASRVSKFESDHTNADGKIIQYFFEDPDGYWLEVCNCHVLTDFCLEKAEEDEAALRPVRFPKGQCAQAVVRLTRMHLRTIRWVKQALTSLDEQSQDAHFREVLTRRRPVAPDEVDEEKMENLCRRRNTYGDICQGFADAELRGALARAGNDVATALLILKALRLKEGQVFLPPSFLVNSETVQLCKPFTMDVHSPKTAW